MLGPLCRGPRSVLVNLLAGFAFPLMPLPGADFFSSGARQHCALRLRNLNTEQPFSYCYELRTQHRLESVATRTPPPICTSALGSLTALVWRAWGAASQLEIHHG